MRYSLQLIDGSPKPFVSAPDRGPSVRLRGTPDGYVGKTEIDARNRPQGPRSSSSPDNPTPRTTQRSGTTRAIPIGFSTLSAAAAMSPPPPAGRDRLCGEYWTLMADELIDAGAFDHVILAPVAVGASTIEQWAKAAR